MIFTRQSADTIFATATAPGRAAIAITRISGDRTQAILNRLIGQVPPERLMTLAKIISPDTKEVLDEALIVYFAKGKSYTGEDSAELHLHGGRAVTQAVAQCLLKSKARLAEPGEFTLRALLNGRMDIAQVEGLGDLIDAQTEKQRYQAMRAFRGKTSGQTKKWRDELIQCLALVETEIEFTDEVIPPDIKQRAENVLLSLHHSLLEELKGVKHAERLREGYEVAIVGLPNSGKSTLLNYLAKRDAAITSSIPGTTRDVLEVQMDLDGLPVNFLDTAGLRETQDRVEQLGISKTKERAKAADLRIFLLNRDETSLPGVIAKASDIKVIAKSDLYNDLKSFGVSGKTGQGVDTLLKLVTEKLEDSVQQVGAMINARQRVAIEQTVQCLDNAMMELTKDHGVDEIAAEEIRGAVKALETITGRIDIENVLGDIFQNFCIGK